MSLEFDPMSDEELHDKGLWTVSNDGRSIESDDFTHDVILHVNGDFYSDEQRKANSDNLAAKLNCNESCKPKQTTQQAAIFDLNDPRM